MWNVNAGVSYYTLNNKLIIENTKTREQTVISDSQVELSCLAVSADFKLIAVGEGSSASSSLPSYVFLYNAETKRMMGKLQFHQKGVQSLAFTPGNKYLATLGVHGGDQVALWDFNEDRIVGSQNLFTTQNMIKVDPNVDGEHCQFFTVGNDATLHWFRYDEKERNMFMINVEAPNNLKGRNFLSLDFTGRLPAPVDGYYVMIGADDGSIVTFSPGSSN